MIDLTFDVPGVPVPQGSKRPLRNQRTGRLCVVETGGARHAQWRADVRHGAVEAWVKDEHHHPVAEPVRLDLTFVLPHTKAHYHALTKTRKDLILREDAPHYPFTMPDLDKLVRAVLDSLSGVIYYDDAQVAVINCRKVYGIQPGVVIRVQSLGN